MNSDSVRKRKLVDKKPESVTTRKSESKHEKEKSKGWCEFAVSVILACVFLIVIVLIILPCPIEPQTYSLKPAPEFKGALEPNTLLKKAKRFYVGEVFGPESIVVDKGHIYTGTADGKVLDIFNGKVKVLAGFGPSPCGQPNQPTCGRPLGMKLDNGFLIVADSYFGLFKVNIQTGDYEMLFSSDQEINGKKSMLFDDVAVTKEGVIYLTDATTKWNVTYAANSVFEAEQSGRLLKYNPTDKTMTEVVSGLRFANGLELSPKEDFLLMCESATASIKKYFLTGPKKGKLEMFNDNLPGLPDNIRRTSRGTYWVAIAGGVRSADRFNFMDFVSDKPWIRTLIMKVFSTETIASHLSQYGLAIELNEHGEIIRSLHDPDGDVVGATTEFREHDGILYIGALNSRYMSQLNLKDING